LDSIIKKDKDRLDTSLNTDIVYINCKDGDQVYIGQTKRHFETRIKDSETT